MKIEVGGIAEEIIEEAFLSKNNGRPRFLSGEMEEGVNRNEIRPDVRDVVEPGEVHGRTGQNGKRSAETRDPAAQGNEDRSHARRSRFLKHLTGTS